MQIIGGELKGRRFLSPPAIRPTQGVVRKALFDCLGPRFESWKVADLFAGSGAVGLEALSRGASFVSFVDKDKECVRTIEKNLQRCLPPWPHRSEFGQTEILCMDAFAAIKRWASSARRFDFIFADPPYERSLTAKILKTLIRCDILNDNAFVAIEHPVEEKVAASSGDLLLVRSKRFGRTGLSLWQKGAETIEVR